MKALLLVEYTHAMGNSSGNMWLYWDLIYGKPYLQGGFIWDWVDQGIQMTDEVGRKYWAYGGDMGAQNYTNDENGCNDGLVFPDRTPHPGLLEVKKYYQDIQFKADDVAWIRNQTRQFRIRFERHHIPNPRFDVRALEAFADREQRLAFLQVRRGREGRRPRRPRSLVSLDRGRDLGDERVGQGTVRVATPAHRRLRPALDYPALRQLVEVAMRLEGASGHPIDIEFGFEEDARWLAR